MTIADKLRFLADRAEDGKMFELNRLGYRFNNGELEVLYDGWKTSEVLVNTVVSSAATLALTHKWTFTEDEKNILRNLPDDYHWIARDESGRLYLYALEPDKSTSCWIVEEGDMLNMALFKHLFQSIQWSDHEPCEFRKYI